MVARELQTSIFAAAAGPDQADDDPALDGLGLDALRIMARNGRARLQMGQTPSREESRAIRDLALLERADVAWPDRTTAAEALGLTAKQMERYVASGLPAPGHSPIPKEPAYQWLLALLRSTGETAVAREQDPAWQAQQEDLRWRRLKNDALEGTLVAEAESRAMSALAAIARDLKAALLYAVPADICACLGPDLELPQDAQHRIRQIIAAAITERAAEAGALDDDDDPQPHTDPSTPTPEGPPP